MVEIEKKQDKQKILSILIIGAGLFTLGISIFHYFGVPTLLHVLIIEVVGSVLFIFTGIILFFTKKRNQDLLLGSFFILFSNIFLLSKNENLSFGVRTLQNVPKAQLSLFSSAVFYIIGVVILILGRNKEDS